MLHPEVTRTHFPSHPLWRLDSRDADRALFETVIALLRSQTEAIAGITRWQQQPARERDFQRVSRQLFLVGKLPRRWLRQLSPWTKPAAPNLTTIERRRRAQQLADVTERIRAEIDHHLEWLTEIQAITPAAGVIRLSEQYDLDA